MVSERFKWSIVLETDALDEKNWTGGPEHFSEAKENPGEIYIFFFLT